MSSVERAVEAELEGRIRADLTHFQQALPEKHAIAWRAYLAALLEWQVLELAAYDRLIARLPEVPDDPTVQLMLGRD
jgi:hypothetical protein